MCCLRLSGESGDGETKGRKLLRGLLCVVQTFRCQSLSSEIGIHGNASKNYEVFPISQSNEF